MREEPSIRILGGLRSSLGAIRGRLIEAGGFTLVELLVVVTILGVVLAGMTTLFVSASTSQIDQSNRVEAQQNARLALDALRREIHCAIGITGAPPAASISLTLGPYCANGGTSLSSPLTVPASGSYSVSAADTSPFSTPADIRIAASSWTIACANKTPTTFTVCTGGVPGSYASGLAVTAITTITWCTKDKNGTSPPAANASPYSLWRYRGASCSGIGSKRADYLTETTAPPAVAQGQVFTGYTAAVAGNLRALTIALPVDLSPSDTKQRYTLSDDIALRNSPRS